MGVAISLYRVYLEDMGQEIIFKMIKLVKEEIKLEKMKILNDYVLLSYVEKSIKNHYMFLSKAQKTTKIHEIFTETDVEGSEECQDDGHELFIIKELLKSILTEKEADAFYYTEILGYSSSDLAKELGITKQAFNQRKNKAIEKLRKYYEKK